MERLVQIKSIIKKKQQQPQQQQQQQQQKQQKINQLSFVIKRAKCFNFSEREIISHLREFITSVKSYFPFSVAA